MEVRNAVMIGRAQHGGGGDDVLGIGVADGLQGAKLAVGRGVAVDDPCHLNIDALIGTGAYEVDFSCTQLSDGDGIAKVQKVVVNNVLDDFLDVRLTLAANIVIAQADIAQIGLSRRFQQFFAMNVVAAHGAGEERLVEEGHVVEDHIGGDVKAPRLHVLGNAACGVDFACGVGYETDENTERCGFVAYGQQNWTAPAGFLPVDVS